ncbi:helix-turn-helix domain-containing protein [Clostridium celatum]|uniref:DNA-binding helix-turn-helix protein n=1 Tax=Clostridium celatum DSM 1785 TaxID=545697 RepID=L1Q8J6_9CLOT|nr:helix-turn-helix domain-containing protein [Clostridium celatum]EKY24040.1 DNA-binding helix-turn-helix protein [Clostridium celatum DSM 1785]
MNLKNIRKEKGLTLSKLSSISSISASYLSELEKGKYEATESKIIRLSLALGITPNELLGWEEIIDNLKSNLNNFI